MKKIIATKLFVWDLGQEKAFLLNFIFLFVYVLPKWTVIVSLNHSLEKNNAFFFKRDFFFNWQFNSLRIPF